jgi:beta-N-acetylhexosaminidase
VTLEEKIGQMLLLGWQGPDAQRVNTQAAALVEELNAGGVIVFTRNAETPEGLRETLTEMQARTAARGLPPLFVSIDQEGGRVSRLKEPHFGETPSAWTLGQTGDPEQARAAARETAAELKAVGINWDFAPVLDVNNNPRNPVIGNRSYSADPQVVAAMGIAAVRGFQDDGGILACGKHFPGHGDTETDSHLALPKITHNRERLETVELVPFRAAIAAGLAAIMSAHILFPALDAELPATLSPRILTGLLRQEMDFSGLIITDCLEMKGVAHGWGTPEAGVLAVLAGADILLCCHTWEIQLALRDALVKAVESGRISESRLDESLARIADAKARWVA